MLGKDRIPFVLGVGAIVVTLGVGTCSTNARIDDLNGRFDDLNRRFDEQTADVNRRFDEQTADVNRRFDALGADVNRRFDGVNRRFDAMRADIRELRADHARFDERLRAVEVAFGQVDQRLLTIERVVLPAASPGE